MDQKQIITKLEETLLRRYGCHSDTASPQQIYRSLCYLVNDMLMEKNTQFNRKTQEEHNKQVYYMSMEFLVGTSLRNNLYNLGLEEMFTQALDKCGIDIHDLYEMEPDAGLGNGGLGRLASCYMDSATTLGIPCTGYSIRYEFGIFKQKIIDGWQMEFPDDWLTMGDVWLVPREDEAVEVKFGGEARGWDDNGKYRVAHINYQSVMAVPNDMYISGHDTKAVNKLVLWSAKSPHSFDMSAFSRGDYAKALEGDTMAEVISKVLSGRVNYWLTFNEPQMFCGLGLVAGVHAPFENNGDVAMMAVTKNILLAHGRAVQILRKNCPGAKVGIAPTGDCCLPKDDSPEEVERARQKSLSDYPGYIMSNTWWADPVFLGRYPAWAKEKFGDMLYPMTDAEWALVSQPLDFYAYNCYQGTVDLVPDPSKYDAYAYQGSPQTAAAWNITPRCCITPASSGSSGTTCPSSSPKTAIRAWTLSCWTVRSTTPSESISFTGICWRWLMPSPTACPSSATRCGVCSTTSSGPRATAAATV